MSEYVKSTLNQVWIAVRSITDMMDKLEPGDVDVKPTDNKYSIGQLLAHMSLICQADLLISDKASEEEMSTFYSSHILQSIDEMKEALMESYVLLENRYVNYSEEELMQTTISYWGVSYTRFEWLLEISSHLYHHRGQLHAMLVHCVGKDPEVALFE